MEVGHFILKAIFLSVLMTNIKANDAVNSVWVYILMHNKSYRVGGYFSTPDQSSFRCGNGGEKLKLDSTIKKKGIYSHNERF